MRQGKPKSSGNFFSRIGHMIVKELQLLKTDKFNLFIALCLLPIAITLYAIMLTQAAVPAPVSITIISYDSNEYLSIDMPDLSDIPENYTEYYQQQYDILLTEYLNGTTGYDNLTAIDPSQNGSLAQNVTISYENRFELPLLESFNASEHLNLRYFYNGTKDYYAMNLARDQLRRKEIACIVVIPADFSELLQMRLPGLLETAPDTTDLFEIQRILNGVQDGIIIFSESQNMTPRFTFQATSYFNIPKSFNPEYNYRITQILSFIVFGVSCVLTILVVVQEKTVARLLLTPVRRIELLTAKYCAYAIVLTGQILLIYLTTILNGLFVMGNPFNLFIAMFLIGFLGIALGFFISTISKTTQEANQLFFAIFIIIVIFSGIFIPLDSMPYYLRSIANFLPLSHADILIRGIISRGLTFNTSEFYFLLREVGVLVVFTFIAFQRRKYEV